MTRQFLLLYPCVHGKRTKSGLGCTSLCKLGLHNIKVEVAMIVVKTFIIVTILDKKVS